MSTKSLTESFLGGDLIEVFIAFVYVPVASSFIGPCSLHFRLYGISLAQSYLYWFNRKRDSRTLQCIVMVLVGLETSHTMLIMQTTYHYVITIAENPASALEIIW